MTQVVLEKVGKAYGDTPALREVSLSFEDGVTTAVIGPSGSGKSTLVQMINGLVRPDSGRVTVFGEAIQYDRLPELRRKIGYAVQGTGLFPHLTVRNNISLLGRLEKWDMRRVGDRVDQLMNLVNLSPELSTRYPHELSGGQQQRVGLCRAMMLNPQLFLLDEPFGALDPITRADIHQEFLHLQKSEPRTVVLVTHDMREAMKLANHVVLLDEGRIVQQGAPKEIRDNPANDFVREFVSVQLSQ